MKLRAQDITNITTAETMHFLLMSPSRAVPVRSSPIDRDVLRLHELHEALMRAFAAKTGLLGAAEWRRRVGDEAAVEADHAEVELFGDPHAAAQVLGVEIRHQPVFGV